MRTPIVFASLLSGLVLGLAASSCGSAPSCASTCDGCCDLNDVCHAGTSVDACGAPGRTCDVCVGPQACVAGACGVTAGGSGGSANQNSSGSTAGGGSAGGGGAKPAFTVSGRVTYDFVPSRYDVATDTGGLMFNQDQSRPVRGAEVWVFEGDTVIAKGVTDANGRYSVAVAPRDGRPLALYALARSVTPFIQVEDNTDDNSIWAISSALAARDATVNLHAGHGWTGAGYDAARRDAAPFAVLDSMYTASQAFLAVRPVQFPPLHVNWSPNNVPQSGNKAAGQIGTSHFTSADGEIYILGKAGADTDEFDAHVIVHEWAHFFEHNVSRSDSPGGRHGNGDVLDPRLAFGEAWGNALAAMLLPESVYSDTSWRSGVPAAFGFDAESEPYPTDDPKPSAFSEASVMRVLYDLRDGANEPHDSVSIDLGTIYDVMAGPQRDTNAVTTLASFVAGLKAQPGVNRQAVDTLLARYQIGALSTQWGDGDSPLRGMFTTAPGLPYTGHIDLGGGYPANSWQQNQYYVFTGTGGTVTISASSTEDVAIAAYRQGRRVGGADATLRGSESFSLSTHAGVPYVVVVTGFGTVSADYAVTTSIQ